jgi:hypothetical protein
MSELEQFVVGYIRQTGGIIEPIAPKVYEALLPEKLAAELGTDPYQQIAFTDLPNGQKVLRLGYNHPLVEEMVNGARAEPAPLHVYVNNLRLTKTGLQELARESWGVSNCRIVELPRRTIGRIRNHYVYFNFKAALTSDEKQERLVAVLMDARTGCRVPSPEPILQAANALEPDDLLKSLSDGPLRWPEPDGRPSQPLALPTLTALLEQAKTAVLHELSGPLLDQQKRATRFQSLDEARLNEYYDEIEQDLQQRLRSATPERRASLESKLASTREERAFKLTDVAERYRLYLDLTLINVMIVTQPKLSLTVGLENRTSKAEVQAVYDPLLHKLEPLVCQACGETAEQVILCFNGHVAHHNCMAPECIDCKRLFCQLCAAELGECAVCHKPLCHHSQIECKQCRRVTCQAHRDMCHANDGRPVDLAAPTKSTPRPEPKPESAPPPKPQPAAKTKPKAPPPKPAPKPPVRRVPAWPAGVPKPQRIEVICDHDFVGAYVLASRERQIALRSWLLDPEQGILVECSCEKGAQCTANNMVMWPVGTAGIERQIMDQIQELRREYLLPEKKIKFNRGTPALYLPTPRLTLFGSWKDEDVMRQAQQSFDRIYRKRKW